MSVQQCFCDKCKKTISVKEFYKTNNTEKYPTGYLNQCKKCLTMFVNNYDPKTFLWILQECDVPYVPWEWDKLLESYGKDPKKMTGTTILGRYLSKMKLVQYNEKRWADTEPLQRLYEKKMRESMTHQGYSPVEIDEVVQEKLINLPEEGFKRPENQELPFQSPAASVGDGYTSANWDDSSDLDIELTEEERVYLRTKWGKTYKPDEWVQLESLYQSMMDSYDIQGAGHEDTLKLACKTSLKSNQLLDMGDIDSAKKMVSMYDQLMKSGNFTAAQNKKDKGEFIDSISELVELCEKEGFIPRYYIDSPKDRVDETILDLQNYTKTLVVEEMNLGNLIEGAVREMVREESKEEDEDIDDEALDFDSIEEIKDQDFDEFNDFIEDQSISDEEAIAAIVKSGIK